MSNTVVSENTRLRKELKTNQVAYAKLNREKDDAIKALKVSTDRITELESLLKLKEQVLIEVRQEKDREIAELVKIKNDLEMRLQSALEAGGTDDPDYQKQSDFTPQGYWTQSGSGQGNQLSCAKAIELLSQWEGVEEITNQLKTLMKEQTNDVKRWKPGTPLDINWKPCIKVFVAVDDSSYDLLELLQTEVFPRLEGFCRNSSVSISFLTLIAKEMEKYSLSDDLLCNLSLQQVNDCDLFIGLLANEVTSLCKSQVEHGFLNNPSVRPSLFLFQNDEKSNSQGASKLKQRIRNSISYTTVIEFNQVTMQVLSDCYNYIENILKTSYNVFEPVSSIQKHVFSHISLVADMRMEYEQKSILESILSSSPQNPVCIDVTFKNLQAYMCEQATAVAPYLITAPTGYGKSFLLAKWIEYLQNENVSVFYHFVTHSSSSSSECCLLYRRFCHKLMMLYDADSNGASLAVDPDSLEDVFTDLLNKAPAVLDRSNLIFFVIDNAESIQDHSLLGWLHKPLPKNVRVVLTVNDSGQYPDSWKHLASSTLPTPTGSDLQEILPSVTYGPKKRKLTEDQIIELVIISQSSFVWCLLAAKFILSMTSHNPGTELDDVLTEMEEATEVPELVKMIIDHLEASYPSITIVMEQILQLVYWSRNGLVVSELQQLLQFPDGVVCFVINELKNCHILWEVNGILSFTHESVLEVMQYKYHCDSQPEDLLIWSETLIRLFSDLKCQVLSRCTEELPWLLKRGELQQDMVNVLLNIDILIHLYCSGQGGLLLKYWRWIGAMKDSIPEQYRLELRAVEDQAGNDETSLLYVAMVMLTVGSILRDYSLLDETQPLLQRALELYESHCEPDSERVANALCELGLLYTMMKKYSAAECLYGQALEIYEHLYNEWSDQSIQVLGALKKIYQETNRPELLDGISERLITLRDQRSRNKPTARTILRSHVGALEKQLNTFDTEEAIDSNYVKLLNELAIINGAFGQESVADELFHVALTASEDVLGSEHTLTQCVLGNWTILHKKMNKIEDAIILQTRIIEIKEKLGQVKDVAFAGALNNLANLLCLSCKHINAIPLYDQAVDIYTTHYGLKHPKTREAINSRELASQKCIVQSF